MFKDLHFYTSKKVYCKLPLGFAVAIRWTFIVSHDAMIPLNLPVSSPTSPELEGTLILFVNQQILKYEMTIGDIIVTSLPLIEKLKYTVRLPQESREGGSFEEKCSVALSQLWRGLQDELRLSLRCRSRARTRDQNACDGCEWWTTTMRTRIVRSSPVPEDIHHIGPRSTRIHPHIPHYSDSTSEP